MTNEQQNVLDALTFYGVIQPGYNNVTINNHSGTAEFAQTIGAQSSQVFTINNSNITINSMVEIPAIMYNGNGIPIVTSYTLGGGVIYITVYNIDTNPTSADIFIHFKILAI